MCLSSVYIDSGGGQKQIMGDVARMEAEAEGFLFIDLFGESKFVRGRIKRIDFIDEHAVVLEPDERKK
ncbi:MAG: CooT family nickel-binding protein [Deltaproteobacteria bacterium]